MARLTLDQIVSQAVDEVAGEEETQPTPGGQSLSLDQIVSNAVNEVELEDQPSAAPLPEVPPTMEAPGARPGPPMDPSALPISAGEELKGAAIRGVSDLAGTVMGTLPQVITSAPGALVEAVKYPKQLPFSEQIRGAAGTVLSPLMPSQQVGEAVSTVKQAIDTKAQAIEGFFEEISEAQPSKYKGRYIYKEPELLIDPTFIATGIIEMAPSLGASLIGGVGGQAAALKIGSKVFKLDPATIQKLAKFGGEVAGGVVGGALEGSGTFKEAKRKGLDDTEAARQATTMGLAASVLNAISVGKALDKAGPGAWNWLKKRLGAGVSESVTELAEEPTEALITGEDPIEATLKGLNVVPAAGLAGAAGSITGPAGRRDMRADQEEEDLRQQLLTKGARLTGTEYTPAEDLTRAVAPEALPPDASKMRPLKDLFAGQQQAVPSDEVETAEAAPEAAPEAPAEKYEFSSTQVNLPDEIAAQVKTTAAAIPDAALADKGREETPHITVKYGLKDNDPTAVQQALAGEKPITVKLGDMGVFAQDEHDVLFVEVEGSDLNRLNQKLGTLPSTETQPSYKPHITLAYLKPGTGKEWAGPSNLKGKELTLDTVTFSAKDGKQVPIKLGQPAPVQAPAPTVQKPVEAAPKEAVKAPEQVAPAGKWQPSVAKVKRTPAWDKVAQASASYLDIIEEKYAGKIPSKTTDPEGAKAYLDAAQALRSALLDAGETKIPIGSMLRSVAQRYATKATTEPQEKPGEAKVTTPPAVQPEKATIPPAVEAKAPEAVQAPPTAPEAAKVTPAPAPEAQAAPAAPAPEVLSKPTPNRQAQPRWVPVKGRAGTEVLYIDQNRRGRISKVGDKWEAVAPGLKATHDSVEAAKAAVEQAHKVSTAPEAKPEVSEKPPVPEVKKPVETEVKPEKAPEAPVVKGRQPEVGADILQRAEAFVAARARVPQEYQIFLSQITPEELVQDYNFNITDNGGVAVEKRNGHITNLFTLPDAPRGASTDLILWAIDNGGRTLDAFDGHLPERYANFGFEEHGRMLFDPQKAPPDSPLQATRPDVVFMAWKGYPESQQQIRDRILGPSDQWRPYGKARYYYSGDRWATAIRQTGLEAVQRGAEPATGAVQVAPSPEGGGVRPVLEPDVQRGAGPVQIPREEQREAVRPVQLPSEPGRGGVARGPERGVEGGVREAEVPGAGAGTLRDAISAIGDVAKAAGDAARAAADAAKAATEAVKAARERPAEGAAAPEVEAEPEAVEAEIEGEEFLAGDGFTQIPVSLEKQVREANRGNVHLLNPRLVTDAPADAVLGEKKIAIKTTQDNAASQMAAVNDTLKKHANPLKSESAWKRMWAYALGSKKVPIYPKVLGKYAANPKSMADLIWSTLSDDQVINPTQGIQRALRIRRYYKDGKVSVNRTGDMMLWAVLSKRASPYIQESMFLDAKAAGIDYFIQKAVDGKFDKATLREYKRWAKRVAPRGSGQPGAGVTNNLRSFGQEVLYNVGRPGADGAVPIQAFHDALKDSKSAHDFVNRAKEVLPKGSGLEIKLLEFIALVTGHLDAMPLDVVQTNHMWGGTKEEPVYSITRMVTSKAGKQYRAEAGGMVQLLKGHRGILMNKVFTDAMGKMAPDVFQDLNNRLEADGRPTFEMPATAGALHWVLWNAASQQAASHGSMAGFERDIMGDLSPYQDVFADETRYDYFKYGTTYGRPDGVPTIRYRGPEGRTYEFTPEAFSEVMDQARTAGAGVLPKDFPGIRKVGQRPFWEYPGVDKDALLRLLGEAGVEVTGGAGRDVGLRGPVSGETTGTVEPEFEPTPKGDQYLIPGTPPRVTPTEPAAPTAEPRRRPTGPRQIPLPLKGKDVVNQVDAHPKDEQYNPLVREATFEALAAIDDATLTAVPSRPFPGGPQGVLTHAHSFRDELINKGWVSWKGHKITDRDSLAQLGQMVLDPRIETHRLVATDEEGNVVWQDATTSNLPSVTAISQSPVYFDEVKQILAHTGAKNLWSMHNHTSADPTPSTQDSLSVRDMKAIFGDIYQGEVVVEGNKYGFLETDGTPTVYDLPGWKGPEKMREASIPHKVLGKKATKVASVALLAHSFADPQNYVLVYANARGEVRGVQTIPKDQFINKDVSMGNWLQEQKKVFGSISIWVYSSTDMTASQNAVMTAYIRTGKIHNFVFTQAIPSVSGKDFELPVGLRKQGQLQPMQGYEFGERLSWGQMVAEQKAEGKTYAQLRDEVKERRLRHKVALQQQRNLLKALPENVQHAGPSGIEPTPPVQPDLARALDASDPDLTMPIPGEIVVDPNLSPELHKKAVSAARDLMLGGNVERDNRFLISDQIMHMIRDGKITDNMLSGVMKRHGLSPTEFAVALFRGSVSDAARRLGELGNLAKAIGNLSPEVKKLVSAISDKQQRIYDRDVMGYLRQLDNTRRALMVTQLGTAMRNLIGQVGRLGIDVLDVGLQRGLQKIAGVPSDKTMEAHPAAALEALTSLFWNRGKGTLAKTPTTNLAVIKQILENFPASQSKMSLKLLGELSKLTPAPTGKVSPAIQTTLNGLSHIADWLNTVNKWQEYAVQSVVLQAELAARTAARGNDLEAMIQNNETEKLHPDDVKAAVNKALELSFADRPAFGSLGYKILDLFHHLPPFLASGPIPFPRFVLAALRYHFEFSPLGLIKLMNPEQRAAIRKGDMKVLSRVLIGTAIFTAALALRAHYKDDDEEWYRLRIPGTDQQVDMRFFNPYSTYFFMADVVYRYWNGTLYNMDRWALSQGILGIGPGSALGLAAIDGLIHVAQENFSPEEDMTRGLKRFVGEIAGSFLVPLRQVQDAMAGIWPYYKPYRDAYEWPGLGPIMKNIPGVPERFFPTVSSPTQEAPVERYAPISKQLGVPLLPPQNTAQAELARYGFSTKEIQTPSGNPLWDRAVKDEMGSLVEERLVPILEGATYQGMSPQAQQSFLNDQINKIEQLAVKRAALVEPEAFQAVKAKRAGFRKRLMQLEQQEESGS